MKSKKSFDEMSEKQRKKFLSNDMIERMIRVEQKVSASFGEEVPYNKTRYYKSLGKREKEEFDKYIKGRGKKKYLVLFLLLVPLIVIGFLNMNMTGQVVKKNVGEGSVSVLNYFLIGLLGFIGLVLVVVFLSGKRREKRFSKHTKVIDDLLFKKLRTKLDFLTFTYKGLLKLI